MLRAHVRRRARRAKCGRTLCCCSEEGRLREGARQRLENLGVPGEVIDRIATEGQTTVSIPIMAPRSGVVLERMAVEGMMSEAGETLFRIADTSTIWVIAEVPETAPGN